MAAQGHELWQACLYGERARALSLLDEGANIEHEGGQWGHTPIIVASEGGHLDVVKMLHGRGKFDSKLVQRLATKAPTKQQHIRINFVSM